jgi:hypothetical protein
MFIRNNLSWGAAVAATLLLGGGAVVALHQFSRARELPAVGVADSSRPIPAPPLAKWDERRLIELAKSDPMEAIRFSRQLENGAERERILIAALEILKDRNPALAAEIVAGLPPGDFQQVAAAQVATRFARIDPVAAWGWARALPDDRTRLRAVREVAAAWAESDPKSATGAVASLASERERQLSALALATVWTRRDPVASLAWAATLQPLGARALVAGSAVQTWAERDAPAALNWLATQPAEFQAAIDPDATLGIIGQWARQDPESVREIILQMTPGVTQARAADIAAVHLAKHDPVATMEWALSLPQEAVRNVAFSTAFRQWSEVAPQSADAWLQEAELTAEEKRRLLHYP